jgi:hypothetical protein
MRKLSILLIALTAFVAAAAWSVRTAAQSQYGDANAQPAPFNPQMGALMGMLIQPRHAKLALAGRAENWPLAAYSLRELRQGFFVTAKAVPRWKGLPVPDLFEASVAQPLLQIDAAIRLKYKRQFDEAFGKLTQACNACHATTEHPFVVIKVPDASAFPNQDFAPKR